MTDDEPDLYALLGVHDLPAPLKHSMNQNGFDAAMAHFRQGNTAEAKQMCLQLLEKDPQHPDVLHALGLIAMQEKAYAQARDYLLRAINQQPQDMTIHLNLGQLYLLIKHYALAARVFKGLLGALAPDEGAADEASDLACDPSSQRPAGAASLHPMVSPAVAAAQLGLGRSLGHLGEYAAALQALEAAITLAGHLSPAEQGLAWMHKGMALGALEQHDAAVPCFEQAIALNPSLVQAHFGLGNACYCLGERVAAEVHLRKTLALDAAHVPANLLLGRLLHQSERSAEALPYFQRTAELAPELLQPHVG